MVSRNFFRFNTTNIISAETDNEDILDEAVEWCDRYELLFSRVDPASELFRLNSAEGRPTAGGCRASRVHRDGAVVLPRSRRVIRRDYGKRHAAVELQGLHDSRAR